MNKVGQKLHEKRLKHKSDRQKRLRRLQPRSDMLLRVLCSEQKRARQRQTDRLKLLTRMLFKLIKQQL